MWEVRFSFWVGEDVEKAAEWYESKQVGLGSAFVDDVIQVWHELAENPLLAARKHPTKNLRWRYPERFPYRIIYEVDDELRTVLVLRVVHAARNDAAWRAREQEKLRTRAGLIEAGVRRPRPTVSKLHLRRLGIGLHADTRAHQIPVAVDVVHAGQTGTCGSGALR